MLGLCRICYIYKIEKSPVEILRYLCIGVIHKIEKSPVKILRGLCIGVIHKFERRLS